MEITVIGLGKMGMSLVKQLNDKEILVKGYDINPVIKETYQHRLFNFAPNIEILFKERKREIVFLVLPAGKITDEIIKQILQLVINGSIIVDFSNSKFKDSMKRHSLSKKHSVRYYDCGISGGVKGARFGACMMMGGEEELDTELEDVLIKLCVPNGFMYHAQPGAGHYLKMVHNGIEYGMMQSIAEGFDLLFTQNKYQFEICDVANLWNHGSIIESFLIQKLYDELKSEVTLEKYKGEVSSSGEALWTIEEAMENEVPVPVIALSLMKRNSTLDKKNYSGKVLSAMRFQFGGHSEFD
ncbi:NADP-dependent phosphogluconate dehydrogenase [Tuanshanicoccus lijuaniae]|uniref:NADP-dependent phosphogluconate dehydrogenase n=1 Tax=Aerococcaceae bacterium zg-1292 TaxID=2774330 RepID=UPI0019358D6C|nr:NADP-dependent phosphogluconate dehydrogenase [Aerococcaceae bacterium zg-1292]QQA36850.1 NADP-dependent phosphogluconate dehydrogenase [Aerococcaceae bacterium zg-1292]